MLDALNTYTEQVKKNIPVLTFWRSQEMEIYWKEISKKHKIQAYLILSLLFYRTLQ